MTQYYKDVNSLQIDLWIHCSFNQIPVGVCVCVKLDKLIVKFTWKFKRPKITRQS